MTHPLPEKPTQPQPFAAPFGYALQGWLWAWRTQWNIRVHCGIGSLVVLAGWFVGLAPWEWAVIGMLIGGMLAVECLNTAIEATVDLVCGDNFHPLAKAAKDVAAGACLLWALTSVVVGLIIFWPKLFKMSIF
ncbi:MAG: diacylglycerol kinase family protein [Vampirovibrionales bacterium]|nr:diacylglycerol kinase family protein [Vampirovibrionales bacterium]